jgi:hypothetical protein
MDDFMGDYKVMGDLKIRAHFAVCEDEHGRVTLGKWVTLKSIYNIDFQTAQKIIREHRASAKPDVYIQGCFVSAI